MVLPVPGEHSSVGDTFLKSYWILEPYLKKTSTVLPRTLPSDEPQKTTRSKRTPWPLFRFSKFTVAFLSGGFFGRKRRGLVEVEAGDRFGLGVRSQTQFVLES